MGAHLGLYSYRLARLVVKVVSFEINAELLADLINYKSTSIQIIPKGLSSSPGEGTLFIPSLDGQLMSGWASLDPNNLPGATNQLTRVAQWTTLDTFQLRDVSFIKVDVEGHELEVLRGAEATLRRCRPMLLVEVKRRTFDAVTTFLEDLGYTRHSLRDLVGIDGSPENSIFVPGEVAQTSRN